MLRFRSEWWGVWGLGSGVRGVRYSMVPITVVERQDLIFSTRRPPSLPSGRLFIPHTLHPTPHTTHPMPSTLHSLHCTLHPTPYAPHPAPHSLHPTPHTPHPTPFTPHTTPFIPHTTLYTSNPTPCNPHPTSHTLHPAPCTLHPTPYTPPTFTLHSCQQCSGKSPCCRVAPMASLALQDDSHESADVSRTLTTGR